MPDPQSARTQQARTRLAGLPWIGVLFLGWIGVRGPEPLSAQRIGPDQPAAAQSSESPEPLQTAGQTAGQTAASGLAQRDPLDAAYRAELAELAKKCEMLGLPRQAALTRDWFVQRDSHRNYIFDPPAGSDDASGGQPDQEAPQLVKQWYSAFRALRDRQAEALFERAQVELAAERAGVSYRLLHEVLRENPNHESARRVLGFRLVDGQWRRPTSGRRPRRGLGPHPKYGFPARSYWTLETENFSIVTSHSQQAGLELGERLEGLYRVWRQLFFRYWSSREELEQWFASAREGQLGLEVERRRDKFNVVQFRDRDQYLKVLGEPQLAVTVGYYVEDQKTAFFYYADADSSQDEGADKSLLPTWYHEATHQLFLESLPTIKRPGNRLNFWVLEGVALYMESLERRDGYYTAGGGDADRLQFARYRALAEHFYMPLGQFTGLGRQELQQHEQIRRLYSQAAGLAAFFLDYEQGRYRNAFEDYLTAVYQGEDEPTSLIALTGQPFAALDQQYIQFLADVDDKQLAFAHQPQNLCLVRTDVTDAGLRLLHDRAEQLTWLDLAYTRVTDAGVAQALAQTPRLDHLNLEGTAVTDRLLPRVGKLVSLTTLDLSKTGISDVGLSHLKALRNLTELWLVDTQISDEGLAHLADLKQLESLHLEGTRVTADGLRRLERALPKWSPAPAAGNE